MLAQNFVKIVVLKEYCIGWSVVQNAEMLKHWFKVYLIIIVIIFNIELLFIFISKNRNSQSWIMENFDLKNRKLLKRRVEDNFTVTFCYEFFKFFFIKKNKNLFHSAFFQAKWRRTSVHSNSGLSQQIR